MNTRQAFASALKRVRKARGLTQEDFSDVSSRTYVSTLERGIKSPTLEKVEAISNSMGINPLVLLVLTYSAVDKKMDMHNLLENVLDQIREIETKEHS